MEEIYKITLPLPPSVNTAYANTKGKGRKGRTKSKAHLNWIASCPPPKQLNLTGPLFIRYTFFFPEDNRRRDLCNYIKVPEDFLVHCNVIVDDSINVVQRCEQVYGGKDKFPRVEIQIYSP